MTHGNQGGKNGNSKKERPVCTYCGIVGHVAYKCYKLHGYPPGYKHKGKASTNQVSSNDSLGSFLCNSGGFGNITSQPMQSFPNQPDLMHYTPQPQLSMPQSQFSAPQFPITQSQCEQLLSFLASQSFKEANASQPSHQAASILSPLSNDVATTGPSSSMPYFANFSGNPFWLPPNFSHSIFLAHIVDRHAYKSNNWIIDTGASDHMVHSVSYLSSITYTINTFVYLPPNFSHSIFSAHIVDRHAYKSND